MPYIRVWHNKLMLLFRQSNIELYVLQMNYNKGEKMFKTTAQKMKSSIKDFFSKCDQIRRKLKIGLHLLKKYLMENFIFCAMNNRLPIFKVFLRCSRRKPKPPTICHHILLCCWVIILLYIAKDIILWDVPDATYEWSCTV